MGSHEPSQVLSPGVVRYALQSLAKSYSKVFPADKNGDYVWARSSEVANIYHGIAFSGDYVMTCDTDEDLAFKTQQYNTLCVKLVPLLQCLQ